MTILVAIPYRSCTNFALVTKARALYRSLTYRDKRLEMFQNDFGYSPDYSTNAAARNAIVERHLFDDITDILWIDVDITQYPADLIERLLRCSAQTGAAIVAPMVYLHAEDSGIDRWYDVGGFQQDGHWIESDIARPPFDMTRDLDSVGACYLIPAEVYRQGARYAVHISEVHHTYDPEHISVMRAAKAAGYRIRCDPTTTVWHAWLPAYNMHWQY